MTSHTTRRFLDLLAALPAAARRQAIESYRLFRADPNHPGLRFKKVHTGLTVYSARVGIGYRALGTVDGETVVCFWIGSHADYDRLLSQL